MLSEKLETQNVACASEKLVLCNRSAPIVYSCNNKGILVQRKQSHDKAEVFCEMQFGTDLATMLDSSDYNEA